MNLAGISGESVGMIVGNPKLGIGGLGSGKIPTVGRGNVVASTMMQGRNNQFGRRNVNDIHSQKRLQLGIDLARI